MSDEKLVDRLHRRLKKAHQDWTKQFEREREALRFQVAKEQWTEEAKRQREGGAGRAPRPMLSVSLLDQPLALVVNQMRQADIAINVHPVSPDADQDTAEAIQGIIRYEDRSCNAELARAWAFDRAVKAGRGAYRVVTVYDDEGGEDDDQRISIQRIYDASGVYFDLSANEPDFSDGGYCIVCTWMTPEDYKAQFPDAKVPDGKGYEWPIPRPAWADEDALLVCEHWERSVKTKRTARGRVSEEVTVRCWKVCADEICEDEYVWPGRFIPIVPVIGEELQSYSSDRHFRGVVEPAMDGQRYFNMALTTNAESLSREPKVPFIGYHGQFETDQSKWNTINTRDWPYIEADPVVDKATGAVLPLPQRMQVDGSRMQLSAAAMAEARELVQTATKIFDASLGKLPQKERSGRAILALQQQAEAGTSGYIQNFVDISMVYEARIRLDLIPKLYDRPNRITRILKGDEKKSEPIMVNGAFRPDPRSGMPMPAPADPEATVYDLAVGRYGVTVSIGKGYQSRMQEGAEFLADLMSKDPRALVAFGDIAFRYRDEPGAQQIAERLANWREKEMPGLETPKDGERPSEEQLMGQIQQMQAQMEMMNQQLQQAMQKIAVDSARQEATMAKAQLDAETKVRISAEETAAKVQIAELENATRMQIAELENRVKVLGEALALEKQQRAAAEAAAMPDGGLNV